MSETTLKTRKKQWKCYKKVCDKYSWGYYDCDSAQACKYISYLSKFMKYTSIVNYYQAVIFYHNIKGLPVAGWSDKLLSQTFKGIKNSNPYVDNTKDPIRPEHLDLMYRQVDMDSCYYLTIWTMILFLFKTLLRVSHVVSSPHTLVVKDIVFTSWGMIVNITSSKTIQRGKPHQIPVSKIENKALCPVYLLKKLLNFFPRSGNSPLFVLKNGKSLSYTEFNSEFKNLIKKAKIQGNFASHSLRRGGTTTLFNVRAPIAYVKDRGQWKSSCIYKYITPTLGDKCVLDKNFTLR